MKTKNTIKRQALKRIAEAPIQRKDLVQFIKGLNGSKSTAKAGYYSDAFNLWFRDELITSDGGLFSIAPMGELYLKDANLYKTLKDSARQKERARRESAALRFEDLLEAVDLLGFDADRFSRSGLETYEEIQNKARLLWRQL